jgi:hypothetical protein
MDSPALVASVRHVGIAKSQSRRGGVEIYITSIGIDLAKNAFSVHWVGRGKEMLERSVGRADLSAKSSVEKSYNSIRRALLQ